MDLQVHTDILCFYLIPGHLSEKWESELIVGFTILWPKI